MLSTCVRPPENTMRDVWIEIVVVVAVLVAIVAVLYAASRRGARRQQILDRARLMFKTGATVAVIVESVTIGKLVELAFQSEKVRTASFPATPAGFEAARKLHPVAIVARESELEARGLLDFINRNEGLAMVLLQRPSHRRSGSGRARVGIICLGEPFRADELLGAVVSAVESRNSTAA